MLQKSARMLNATSAEHVLYARSVERIDVRSARWRAEWGAEWARGKLDSAFVRREDSFGARATGKLASNACVKPATTCKQLHEMSVAASPMDDVDA